MATLDQFYTKSHVSKELFDLLQTEIDICDFDVLLEPSAGRGAFFMLLDKGKREGIDLEPKCTGVKKGDFFDYSPDPSKKYLVVGNPPFGRGCSLAVKFFNKAAEFADVIAFIIPRTFKRISIKNRLALNFALFKSHDLPIKPCCFEPAMSAKCCFQIWRRGDIARQKIVLPKTHTDFVFLRLGPLDQRNQPTPPQGADFALKAYGGKCGFITSTKLESLRPKSWHWLKSNIDADMLIERFNHLDYSVSCDTVRQNSIGRGELVQLYQKYMDLI